jgi:DNA-binding NarL/FixJ family response regulator
MCRLYPINRCTGLLSGVPGFVESFAVKREIIIKGFNIPVMYVTSHSDGPVLERVRKIRPDGFIVKSFDDNDLRVAIGLVLK